MSLPPNFPVSLDALANPSATTNRDDPGFELDLVIARIQDILEALEAKVGIGASTAVANTVLRGTAAGVTGFGQIVAGDLAPGAVAVKLGEVVGTGSSPTLEVSSIPATYRNLVLSWVGRSTVAATSTTATLTFETTPTAGLYCHQRMIGQGSSVTASENIGTTASIAAGAVSGASSNANVYGGGRIVLLEYASTSWAKLAGIQGFGAANSAASLILTELTTGLWLSTAAIARVRLTLVSGNWTAASRMTVYGEPG